MIVPSPSTPDGAHAEKDSELPLAMPPAELPQGATGSVEEEALLELQLDDEALREPAPAPAAERTTPGAARDGEGAAARKAAAARRRRRSRLLGSFFVALSMPVFAAWVYQVWLSEGEYKLPGGPSYFNIPRTFWSTAVFSVALGILLEGVCRRRAR